MSWARHAAEAAAPTPAGLLGRDLGGVPIQQVDDEEAAAHRLEEVAAIELEPVGRALAQLVALELDLGRSASISGEGSGSVAHRLASFTDRAAVRIAAMIRV